MKLSKELAKIFQAGIEKVMQREINEIDYLPQSQFADSKTPCGDRADQMVLDAIKPVIDTLALSIANHREQTHNENHEIEIEELEKALTDSQIEVSTKGWWRY